MQMKRASNRKSRQRRNLQANNSTDEDVLAGNSTDYAILFGGDASVSYTCLGMSATWNRDFYYLTGPEEFLGDALCI
jgi:hypothetical protein